MDRGGSERDREIQRETERDRERDTENSGLEWERIINNYYTVCPKSLDPIHNRNLLYKMVQDFLDRHTYNKKIVIEATR